MHLLFLHFPAIQDIEFLSDFTSSYFEGTGKYNKKFELMVIHMMNLIKLCILLLLTMMVPQVKHIYQKLKQKIQKRLVNFTYEARNNSLHQRIEMSRPCWDLVDLMKEKELELKNIVFIYLLHQLSF